MRTTRPEYAGMEMRVTVTWRSRVRPGRPWKGRVAPELRRVYLAGRLAISVSLRPHTIRKRRPGHLIRALLQRGRENAPRKRDEQEHLALSLSSPVHLEPKAFRDGGRAGTSYPRRYPAYAATSSCRKGRRSVMESLY